MRHLLFFIFVFQLGAVTAKRSSKGADIVFVLDSSDRIGNDNFLLIREWLQSVVKNIPIGPSDNQVAVISYGGGAHLKIFLSQSKSLQLVLDDIGKLSYYGGRAAAGSAVEQAQTQAFTSFLGGRKDRAQVIVHVGAGGDTDAFVDAVQNAIKDKKIVFNVAIGGSKARRNETSSSPANRFYFHVDSADLLTNVTVKLTKRLSQVGKLSRSTVTKPPSTPMQTVGKLSRSTVTKPPSTPMQTVQRQSQPTAAKPTTAPKDTATTMSITFDPPEITEKIDMIFVIDGSSTISPDGFQVIKQNLKDVISKMAIGENGVQVGILQFSDDPEIEVHLNQHVSRAALVRAIDNIVQLKGESRIDLALETLIDMFSLLYEARQDSTRAAILITDGMYQHNEKVRPHSVTLRGQNVKLSAIGIGSQVDASRLQIITGDASLVHSIDSFAQLSAALMKAVASSRKATGTKPPTTLPTTPKDPCFDVLPKCRAYSNKDPYYCYRNARANIDCRKTCTYCYHHDPLTPAPCIDEWKNCTKYDVGLCNSEYHPWPQGKCNHFCGRCDPNGKTTGFYGKCFYKGKAYETGKSWTEGCNYICTCVDGREGQYECYNRCPIYFGLDPDCTLVKLEGDCCLRPVCYFQKTVKQVDRIGMGTESTGEHVCEYNGTQYRQNEVFQDGCEFLCQCVDASKGEIACSSLCPTYAELPSKCRLIKDEGDCCQRPFCEFSTAVGKIHGHGTTTGYGEVIDAKPPPCQDKQPNCKIYGKEACTGYKDYMRQHCRAYCEMCEDERKCYFERSSYHEGEELMPWGEPGGCNNVCVCDSAYHGYVRCFSRCVAYDGLRDVCKEVMTDNDCCPKVHCALNVSIHSSTTNLRSLGSGKRVFRNDTWGNMSPIVPISLNNHLDLGNDNLEFYMQSIRGCLLNDQALAKGEMAVDGKCGPVCTCLDEVTGKMSCRKRCPVYTADKSCDMIPSPRDSCCQVPKCPPSISSPSPTYPEPEIVYALVQPPDPKSLVPTGPVPLDPFFLRPKSKAPKPAFPEGPGGGDLDGDGGHKGPNPTRGNCTYKPTGKSYREGDSWTVPCKLNCICVDGKYGQYICTDVCVHFECPPKAACTEYPDPDFPCCNLLKIHHGTLPPATTGTTQSMHTTDGS